MAGEAEVLELVERVDRDTEFARSLDEDPFTALQDAGFGDLAVAAEQERDRVAELVDRIYRDDRFRQSVEEDPRGTLGDWGIPEAAVESVLIVAGAPEAVLERATVDVEAHLSRRTATFAAVATTLGTLAFAQQASAGVSPAATNQAKPATVSNQISREIANPAISHAVATPQVNRIARASWHGVGLQRVQSQRIASAFLHIHPLSR
jgi:hypothetical protein